MQSQPNPKPQFGGYIIDGKYTQFITLDSMQKFTSDFLKANFLDNKIITVGDVHKVSDYGNDLPNGPDREHWKDVIGKNFDFLLSYVSKPSGPNFESLKPLSLALNKTIFVSFSRGNRKNRYQYHASGSKAWFMNNFVAALPNVKFYLLDDADDHVRSVNDLADPRLEGIMVEYDDNYGIDVYDQMKASEREQRIMVALERVGK